MRRGTGVLSIFLSLALLASGCEKIDRGADIPGVSDHRIDFPTPLVSVATKADQDNRTDYPETSTFGVYGLYYPDGDFNGWETTEGASLYIPGIEFKFNDKVDDSTPGAGAWISDPAYYWMKTGKMTFAAWSPFHAKDAGELSYGRDGLSVVGFSTGDNGDCDLMYSERVYNRTSSEGDNSVHDGIDIVFHHALAGLKFKIVTAEGSSAKISVSRIVLWGMKRKGDFKENVDESKSSYESKPVWENLEDEYSKKDSLVVEGGESIDAFIIPQEITSDARMKVYYTVRIGNSNPVPAVTGEIRLAGSKISGTETEIAEWKLATRYVYTLIFSDLYPIKFSVDVLGWGRVDSDIYD